MLPILLSDPMSVSCVIHPLQDAEMRVVYPEIMARHEVRRFVAWDCRKFLSNGDDSVCSKDQLPALGACSKTYQEIIPANLCPSGIITEVHDGVQKPHTSPCAGCCPCLSAALRLMLDGDWASSMQVSSPVNPLLAHCFCCCFFDVRGTRPARGFRLLG